ncbi:hypothetical protein TrRE_jg8553 [Triparma retinervis]|uniref:Large ribosomal subunit protein uL3m n=1 Tax=Triparma retinervis TaxID=2557542 RepID=A0A9W7FHH2_9STRA|nr:hypothetical protein TrRE_jg8553 [Triparma retinervis]
MCIKVGCTQVWDEWGILQPVTVLHADRNRVLQVKRFGKEGYASVQVGAGGRKKKNERKPDVERVKGFMDRDKWNAHAKRTLEEYGLEVWEDGFVPDIVREFRVHEGVAEVVEGMREEDEDNILRLGAGQFVVGQKIDASGTTKGKGFQGVMKKHGFKGQPATHGVSKTHRHAGSTGQCQDPGRVFKGKKMAGRMGGERRTVQNLEVIAVDRGRELVYVKGQVPGPKGGWIEVRDSKKLNGLSGDLAKGVNEVNDGDDIYEGGEVPLVFKRVKGVDGSGREVWVKGKRKLEDPKQEEILDM